VLVVVFVLENPDRFAIRLTEQISSIGLFAVPESQCTEDEHDDDSKFRNLGLTSQHTRRAAGAAPTRRAARILGPAALLLVGQRSQRVFCRLAPRTQPKFAAALH
jgi:hypothetical protein